MTDEAYQDDLYPIINRMLKKYGSGSGAQFCSEINIFNRRYLAKKYNNPQLDAFRDDFPLPGELSETVRFGLDLEDYYQSIMSCGDVAVSEVVCRRLYNYLQKYKQHIEPDNKTIYSLLERSLEHNLPEHKERAFIMDFNDSALEIAKQYRDYKKKVKKGVVISDSYKYNALHFFSDLGKAQPEINDMKDMPEKVALYKNCLDIVNCLPSAQYGKLAKFRLKLSLCKRLKNASAALGYEYKEMRKYADGEILRYQNAIDRTEEIIQKRNEPERRGRTLSIAEQNRRAYEEWMYK